ncbi:MAG: hypothetical protein RIQ33_559 [Bacteroidota bacterium]|jgi:uncharacterized membrane protein
MKSNYIYLIGAVTLFSIAISCQKKKAKEIIVPPTTSQNFCDTISYAKHVQMVVNICSGCHTSSPRHIITDYASFKAEIDNGSVVLNSSNHIIGMGKDMSASAYADLTALQNNRVKCWIENGMKNN